MESFSAYFKELFEKSDQTKASLARGLGLKHQAYIHNILNAKHIPTIENVVKIAQIFKCSKDETKKLLLLAATERTPNDVQNYFNPRTTLNPVWKVSELKDVFWPKSSTNISSLLNEEFFNANTILLESDIFDPPFKKGQKLLIAEYDWEYKKDHKNFNIGDLVIIDYYGDDPEKETQQHWGELVKSEKSSWSIKDMDSGKIEPFDFRDIVRVGKIIGVLF